jgi:CRISPR-associated exonuclease Cas4
MEALPVTAVKNWLYCPRQVYFTLSAGVRARATGKMEEGRAAHVWERDLEARRSVERYGLAGRRRRFGVRLSSGRLGLSGCPDLLLEGEDAVAVVEFKLTGGEPGPGDWFQLAAYALLVEEGGQKVDRLIWRRIPDGALYERMFSAAWRVRTEEVLGQIRECVGRQLDPGPVAEREKCTDCEFQNFCSDVW